MQSKQKKNSIQNGGPEKSDNTNMGAAHGKSAYHAGDGSASNMSADVEALVHKLTEVRNRKKRHCVSIEK